MGTFGRSNIMFSHVNHLLQSQEDKTIEFPLKSTACVLTIALSNDSNDIPILINFVKAMKVRIKALLIIVPSLNSTMLSNMTINFPVRIFQHDDKEQIISICPVLGSTHAQLERGKCSKDLQMPTGKNLPISYQGFGDDVYIKYSNPISGCDIYIMDIMAKKFKFSYELIHPTGNDANMFSTEVIHSSGPLRQFGFICGYMF